MPKQAGLKAGFVSGTLRNTGSSQVSCSVSTGTNKTDYSSSPSAHGGKIMLLLIAAFWNCICEQAIIVKAGT